MKVLLKALTRCMKDLRSYSGRSPAPETKVKITGHLIVVACMVVSIVVLSMLKASYCPPNVEEIEEHNRMELQEPAMIDESLKKKVEEMEEKREVVQIVEAKDQKLEAPTIKDGMEKEVDDLVKVKVEAKDKKMEAPPIKDDFVKEIDDLVEENAKDQKLEAPPIKGGLEKATDDQVEEKEKEEAKKEAVWDPSKPLCFATSKRSDTCDAAGDIRITGASHTIYFRPSPATIQKRQWKIKPYTRKNDPPALAGVAEWTLSGAGDPPPPPCTHRHSVPAVVFSVGGFSGNLFHDFTDVLVPLFATADQFSGEVQLVAGDSKKRRWLLAKYSPIFNQISNYEVVEAESVAAGEVHCYPRAIVGTAHHGELAVDPSRSHANCSTICFKEMLRRAYGLERSRASSERKPKLMIISRGKSRVFLNAEAMVSAAEGMGFDVVIGEAGVDTDIGGFAKKVNSVDVLLGAHGAGLTNMVFLPEGAVVVQVVPFGSADWLPKSTFGDPAAGMGIRYLEYRVRVEESTLSEKYPKGHQVLTDPRSVSKNGWDSFKKIYLDEQDFRIDLGRLREKLAEALRLLPRAATKKKTTMKKKTTTKL